jgi:hypothetical protein
VLRWLELEPGWYLRYEGYEDIDRIAPDGTRLYEQVKRLQGAVGLESSEVKKVLRGFLERCVAETRIRTGRERLRGSCSRRPGRSTRRRAPATPGCGRGSREPRASRQSCLTS